MFALAAIIPLVIGLTLMVVALALDEETIKVIATICIVFDWGIMLGGWLSDRE